MTNFNRNMFQSSSVSKRSVGRIALVVGALAIVVLVGKMLTNTRANSSANVTSGEKVALTKPLATASVNQTFEFPLLDQDGNEVSRIKYALDKAELRDEVIVKGQRARAVNGKAFLTITLKITNSYEQGIDINSRDYVRLSVVGSPELKAPSIHNDPVEVQAISTKESRVGFTVEEGQKQFTVYIGEIKGEKQIVELNFN
jgi:hypothetical protein